MTFLTMSGLTKILKKDESSEKRRKFWKKTKTLKKDENSEKGRKFCKRTKILKKDENKNMK